MRTTISTNSTTTTESRITEPTARTEPLPLRRPPLPVLFSTIWTTASPAPPPAAAPADNVSDIAEHLRSKHAVVLNLEATNKDVARRLVDFLSGCAYALDGKIKKIAISTYLITPYNVDILGDVVDELENNGLYL